MRCPSRHATLTYLTVVLVRAAAVEGAPAVAPGPLLPELDVPDWPLPDAPLPETLVAPPPGISNPPPQLGTKVGSSALSFVRLIFDMQILKATYDAVKQHHVRKAREGPDQCIKKCPRCPALAVAKHRREWLRRHIRSVHRTDAALIKWAKEVRKPGASFMSIPVPPPEPLQ